MVEEEPVDNVKAASARGQEEEIAFLGLALVGKERGVFGQHGGEGGHVIDPAGFHEAGRLVFVEGAQQHFWWGGGLMGWALG